ncbi:MAG: DNA replication/repair protein RecF [Eubacteriales bacterium]|nr:DNA replication/repair protein RecF [Eubacteriales bacterium]
MMIQSLELANFRNYESLCMDFSPGTNILYGDNAQGKTNVLEALYMIATTKSHRGMKDRDLIRFGQEEAHIRTCILKSDIDYQIDMHLRKSKSKGIAINGQRIKKAADLIGLLHIVFFSPEDLAIVKNGPSERRRFMDMELCQLDRSYLFNLNHYNKIVDQRNKLLRDLYLNPELKETIGIWDMQLLSYGSRVIERRAQFIRELNEIVEGIHGKLSGGREHLTIAYEPDVTTEEFERRLKASRERDIRLKMTCVGPHRDDFSFVDNEIDIRKFGSQGQQRTCALSLKLSEIELVTRAIGDKPVLMLDDVLSELDSGRQNYLLSSIGGIQTFITCTGLDEFVNNRFSIDRLFEIREGKVVRDSEEDQSGKEEIQTEYLRRDAVDVSDE